MFYPVLTSPEEGDAPEVRVANLIQTIETPVDMGEEPNEIEYELDSIIPEVVSNFTAWAAQRGMTGINSMLPLIAEAFMKFCYLIHYGEVYPGKVPLFRIGKRHDEKFPDLPSEPLP